MAPLDGLASLLCSYSFTPALLPSHLPPSSPSAVLLRRRFGEPAVAAVLSHRRLHVRLRLLRRVLVVCQIFIILLGRARFLRCRLLSFSRYWRGWQGLPLRCRWSCHLGWSMRGLVRLEIVLHHSRIGHLLERIVVGLSNDDIEIALAALTSPAK